MTEDQPDKNENEIIPEMTVEATRGDLGEQDVSPAKVKKVVKDQQDNVEAIEVPKGRLFSKRLDVPVDRIQAVDRADSENGSPGKVTIDAGEHELESLNAPGPQTLPPEHDQLQEGLLDQVEQQVPTTEGVREKESKIYAPRLRNTFLRVIGPGLLAGTPGNDPSAVTAYAVAGANAGYAYLWLMLLTTPLYQAVQFACAKIGRITKKG